MKTAQKITIEPLGKFEKNFVIQSFLKSNMNKGINHLMPRDFYYEIYNPIVENMISDARFKIDCIKLASNPDLILGYIIHSKKDDELFIHYLFVKFNYRKSGLAKALVENIMADRKEYSTDNYPHKINGKSKIKTEFMGYPFNYKPRIGIKIEN